MTESTLTHKKYKTLIFDLDGTLLDSFSVHYEVYQVTFARFGIPFEKDRFLESYSPNWYKTYEAMGLPREHWETADAFWVKEAEKRNPGLLPGAMETLEKLNSRYSLGLVTSGSGSRVKKDLERTGINRFFETVITGDDIQHPKPAPQGLEIALLNLGVRASEAAYIGDSYADYQMAEAAGVSFVGVLSDFASLNGNDPDYRICHLTDLPALFEP